MNSPCLAGCPSRVPNPTGSGYLCQRFALLLPAQGLKMCPEDERR